MKKYFVYILLCSDRSYYTGVTNDVYLREEQHNKGIDKKAYTFNRRPVKLVWFQEFVNPDRAIAKEKQLKGWSRKKKEALINNNLEGLPELSRNSLRQHFDKLSVTAQTDNFQSIIEKLPYQNPFLFVDSLSVVNENGVVGEYTFKADAGFYKGHFKNFPVTPGVLLTECCAQIGLVCLGIYFLGKDMDKDLKIGLSSSDMEFLQPVYPNERVTVRSELVYFRFHKLKCKVKMYNAKNEVVCKGVISGMFKASHDEK
ncbi:GIY-YIG nuclease family protein [Croceitalea marina]|uniref:GIY-YIG nuclease family protein n=1 Tax=Croceitalea marina TaxID=1775166 RepID=A0ABW5MVA6_9FLAO